MPAVWDRLTPENLSVVQVKNGDGLTVGNYKALVLVSGTSTVNPDGIVLTYFTLREKTDIDMRLDAVEEGQAVQPAIKAVENRKGEMA